MIVEASLQLSYYEQLTAGEQLRQQPLNQSRRGVGDKYNFPISEGSLFKKLTRSRFSQI